MKLGALIRPAKRFLALALAFLVPFTTAIVGGCGSTSDPGRLYLERLAGALGQSAGDYPLSSTKESPLALFPRGDELLITRAERKLSILNLLEVHRCDLGSLVGARNSGLGRVHTPSQRFLYDLELFAGLKACKSAGDALRSIETERGAELPISAFNALFAGEEWHNFVTPPAAAPAAGFDSGSLARALASLLPLLSLEPADQAARANFEEHLSVLRFSRALGEQRRSWMQQSRVLETATQMLLRAQVENPGCRNGTPTEAGRIRRNVFETYYAQGYQPQLAVQAQPDRGWLALVSQLLNATLDRIRHTSQGRRVARWHAQVLGADRDQEFGRWKAAIDGHTQAWQWQLRACGLLPVPTST